METSKGYLYEKLSSNFSVEENDSGPLRVTKCRKSIDLTIEQAKAIGEFAKAVEIKRAFRDEVR